MLQRILDNIEGILVELKDNDIDFELDVKDKRLNMFRMDIILRKSWRNNTFDPEYFFDKNGKMFNYISEALLTLDTYLKKLGMNVKVHCRRNRDRGFNITMEEFTEMDPKNLNLVIIGINKDHRTPKLEKRVYSFSQFLTKQWMERIGKTNESLVVPRQPIDQMTDTFIPEVFDKFDIDYCKPEDEEKMGNSRTPYWTFVFEDRDGKPYEQFLDTTSKKSIAFFLYKIDEV